MSLPFSCAEVKVPRRLPGGARVVCRGSSKRVLEFRCVQMRRNSTVVVSTRGVRIARVNIGKYPKRLCVSMSPRRDGYVA